MSLHQTSKTSHQTSKAFAITFDLPFDRQAIWKAIHARNGALGVDSATRVEHEPPSDKQCVERSSSVRAPGTSALLEEGTIRRVMRDGATTVSKLVCLCDDMNASFLVWEVLSQDLCRFMLKGGSAGVNPRTSVYLQDLWAARDCVGPIVGTSVTLGYDYASVENPFCCFGRTFFGLAADVDAEFKASAKGVAGLWKNAMLERGHVPIDRLQVTADWEAQEIAQMEVEVAAQFRDDRLSGMAGVAAELEMAGFGSVQTPELGATEGEAAPAMALES